jgi:uncharacterized protein YndB with AHSA1/START domain
MKTEFVYTTYIKTTPQKLWKALTTPEFMKQYWMYCYIKTDWKPGSPWQLLFTDGQIADQGEIVECKPSKRLVLKWRNEWNPKMKAEGYSRCVMDIEPCEKAVKLTVTHSMQKDKSKFIGAVSGGWPFILSNLKSLLETGKVVLSKKVLKK